MLFCYLAHRLVVQTLHFSDQETLAISLVNLLLQGNLSQLTTSIFL